MYANYHTHTYLCNHATGEMEKYVEAAVKMGIKRFGFSDHIPQPFSGFFSNNRMKTEQTETYVNEVLRLKEKYKDKLEIFLGYEAEYCPELFEKSLENVKKYPCDFLILGQHFADKDGRFINDNPPNEENLVKYVNQIIAGIKTKKFSCLAHPDFIKFSGDIGFYRSQMLRLCSVAKQYDIPIELNMLGIYENRHYPNKRFWEIAARTGNKVVVGIDAHSPEQICLESYEKALEILKSVGITPLGDFPLIKP